MSLSECDIHGALLDYLKEFWIQLCCRKVELRFNVKSHLPPSCSGVLINSITEFKCIGKDEKLHEEKHKFGKVVASPMLWHNVLCCQIDGQDLNIMMQGLCKAIITCSSSNHLLTPFLLLFHYATGRNYFPGDPAGLSVSILVLRHTAVHYLSLPPVPSVGHFLCKGQSQSISSATEGAHLSLDCHYLTSIKNNSLFMMDGILCKGYSMNTTYSCKQIRTCTCSKRKDIKMIRVSDHLWLHKTFSPSYILKQQRNSSKPLLRNIFRFMFLILFSSHQMFHIVNAETPHMTDNIHTPMPYYVRLLSSPHPPVTLFCDQYPITHYLNDEQLQDCDVQRCDPDEGWNCCIPITNVLQEDKKASTEVSQFLSIISKYATTKSYSVQWSIDDCMRAYKNWICSHHHNYYQDVGNGTRIKINICKSVCTTVETSCPFFRVHNKTKLYGGQPTFLCEGFQEDYILNETGCHNMSEFTPMPRYELDQQSYPSSTTKSITTGLVDHNNMNTSLNSSSVSREIDSFSLIITANQTGLNVTSASQSSKRHTTLLSILLLTLFHTLFVIPFVKA